MPNSGGLLFLYGLREIATGVGLLRAKNRTPWLWGRVAGDALDLATLAAHARPNNKLNIGLGMAAVASVTALDVTMALAMSERDELAHEAGRIQRSAPVFKSAERRAALPEKTSNATRHEAVVGGARIELT